MRPFLRQGLAGRRSNPDRADGAGDVERFLAALRRQLAELSEGGSSLRIIEVARPLPDLMARFVDIEAGSAPSDVIAVTGVFPNHPAQGRPIPSGRRWFGEAWLLKLLLERYRPDLSLLAADLWPSGVLLVGKLDPASRYLKMAGARLCGMVRERHPAVPDEILRRRGCVQPGSRAIARFLQQAVATPPARPLPAAARTCNRSSQQCISDGLFVTHLDTPRIRRHFERLCAQSRGLIAWTFAYNPGHGADPDIGRPYRPAAECMPRRHAEFERNGGVQGGLLDIAIFPPAAALERSHVWIAEYDVDFSGDWRSLFERYAGVEADLVTSSLTSRAATPDWFWWNEARAPENPDSEDLLRAFHPLVRLSRRMIQTYISATNEQDWAGHYEFTLPTVAARNGLTIGDLGGGRGPADGPIAYLNNPRHRTLAPGTLLWRPSRHHYFHEAPETFELENMIYHPIKPDIDDWDRT